MHLRKNIDLQRHNDLRGKLKWGTLGKNPTLPIHPDDYQFVFIKDLSNKHIFAILKTESWHLEDWYIDMLKDELYYRQLFDIHIEDVEKYYRER